jgi:hypothetical protein
MLRNEFLVKFADESWEPFEDIYRLHLDKLIQIATNSGEPIEGSTFFWNHATDFSKFVPEFKKKRRLLSLSAVASSCILEIGFNAGFSALLMLVSNEKLRLTSVDIAYHNYTIPCAEYLKSVFGERFEIIIGNSLNVLPSHLTNFNDYDILIIDGGHGIDLAESDLLNACSYCNSKTRILFDDSDHVQLRPLLDLYIIKGMISPISDSQGYLHNTNQMLFKINKKS